MSLTEKTRILRLLTYFVLLLTTGVSPAAGSERQVATSDTPEEKASNGDDDMPVAGGSASAAGPVAHQAEDAGAKVEHAEALKAQGDALFRGRRYLDAIVEYDKAYVIHPNPRLLYNKGRALEALGRYAEALRTLERFKKDAPPELIESLRGFDALLTDLAKHVAQLYVRVNVRGAEIVWAGTVLGRAPLTDPLAVSAGSGRLSVKLDGYFPFERELVLAGGERASFEVVLESKAMHGKLTLESSVPGTTIIVDGRRLGLAPTEAVLPPGTHQVVARREGYEEAASQVVLEAGQHRKVAIELVDATPAIYERWWFWSGVGVIVAGGAATAILATRDRETTSGDFSPDTINAGAFRF